MISGEILIDMIRKGLIDFHNAVNVPTSESKPCIKERRFYNIAGDYISEYEDYPADLAVRMAAKIVCEYLYTPM